jgi:hypothetical protein
MSRRQVHETAIHPAVHPSPLRRRSRKLDTGWMANAAVRHSVPQARRSPSLIPSDGAASQPSSPCWVPPVRAQYKPDCTTAVRDGSCLARLPRPISHRTDAVTLTDTPGTTRWGPTWKRVVTVGRENDRDRSDRDRVGLGGWMARRFAGQAGAQSLEQ